MVRQRSDRRSESHVVIVFPVSTAILYIRLNRDDDFAEVTCLIHAVERGARVLHWESAIHDRAHFMGCDCLVHVLEHAAATHIDAL